MIRYNEHGAIDVLFVVALVLIVIGAGFIFWRVSEADKVVRETSAATEQFSSKPNNQRSYCTDLFSIEGEIGFTVSEPDAKPYETNGITIDQACELTNDNGELTVSIALNSPDEIEEYIDKISSMGQVSVVKQETISTRGGVDAQIVEIEYGGFVENTQPDREGHVLIPREKDFISIYYAYAASNSSKLSEEAEELVRSITLN